MQTGKQSAILHKDDMILLEEWAAKPTLCIMSKGHKAISKGQVKMAKKETYEAKAEEMLLPIVESHGFELVDVEYVKEGGTWYLRAYIDKPGGITIDDCEMVSRAFSDVIDQNDFIEDSYIMEVSSPGLLRPLKKR